ncbi:unnamed protein product [Phytophthora lilii]|uniref:Unnamed protein product n=1 Tax=Phytophthora lilii TaxID=2077276 RepID=A0A9W6TZZ5_9STRA|nr:unnamed protein product [Phytophthora lilii]
MLCLPSCKYHAVATGLHSPYLPDDPNGALTCCVLCDADELQVDIRIRVKGGGHTAQIYAIRQAIAKAIVAYYQKCKFVVGHWSGTAVSLLLIVLGCFLQTWTRPPRRRSRTSYSPMTVPSWSPTPVAARPRSSVVPAPALASRSPLLLDPGTMAVTGKRGVGIPTILLHDGEGTIVFIEMKTGETYRGLLDETEDNMNCVMKEAVRTDINGNTTQVEQVYLRGSQILFIVFPDIYPFCNPTLSTCVG